MATFDFATETSRITSRPAIATRVVNTISNVYLADIGLTRADLHVAIEVPFGRDPTERLRIIAADRTDTIEDIARKVA
ncbi:MAG: hypothetical protein E5W01_16550 [Mesorhizobium sp.]|nr:MAG: hypothetical protein E5W01_16550 [Mesorhizobium sp.]